jgi:hypothetical protein
MLASSPRGATSLHNVTWSTSLMSFVYNQLTAFLRQIFQLSRMSWEVLQKHCEFASNYSSNPRVPASDRILWEIPRQLNHHWFLCNTAYVAFAGDSYYL